MRFKGLDLNLLMVFDVLLETRSVSRTAERLNRSQAAVSAALGRLRDYFDDEILVLDGRKLHPTAHAQSLLPLVRECLRAAEVLTDASARFDPARSDRTFNVMAADSFVVSVMAPLIRRLSDTAPGVRLELAPLAPSSDHQLGAGAVDLAIIPERYASREHPAELLYEEQHVLVGCAANRRLRQPMSEAEFFAARHVGVIVGGADRKAYADEMLEVMGKPRDFEVMTASFTAVPWLLMGTEFLALMQERLAVTLARSLPLAIAPCPIDIPPMAQVVQHHRARRNDEGLKWLRQELAAEIERQA